MQKIDAQQFFKQVKSGLRIRYGPDDSPPVLIGPCSRNAMYAWGQEEGTERRIFLILRAGLLNDAKRGNFREVVVLA